MCFCIMFGRRLDVFLCVVDCRLISLGLCWELLLGDCFTMSVRVFPYVRIISVLCLYVVWICV